MLGRHITPQCCQNHTHTNMCTYRDSSNASSTKRSVGLKISLSEGWGRGGVIPGWINIEQQPDGDETRKTSGWKEAAGERERRNFADICIHVPTHRQHTHATSYSHITKHSIFVLTDTEWYTCPHTNMLQAASFTCSPMPHLICITHTYVCSDHISSCNVSHMQHTHIFLCLYTRKDTHT